MDLEEGCHSGINQEVSREHAMRAKKSGAIISSAFVVWQDSDDGRKGIFVVNLSKQSKCWKKGSVRMETLSEFAMAIQRNDHFLSMDIEKGYRAFHLVPAMREWFIFRWEGRYYQCVALSFGWGRAPLWFTQLMVPFVKTLRQLGYRVLAYLDDFLIAPSPVGIVASLHHCTEAKENIEKILKNLGLQKHPSKGEWNGSTSIEHLGVHIDSASMKFFLAKRKLRKVRDLAYKLLRQVRLGRRWVSKRDVMSFCGFCVSLTLAMPWARFYTRSLYWDVSNLRRRDLRGRFKLSHQSIRDLKKWCSLTKQELDGRPMIPTASAAIHSDAADTGYGGTPNEEDLRAGIDGHWRAQGIWNWRDRAESISFRELKAIRLLLSGNLGTTARSRGHQQILLHVDNQAVVHIANSFVSASKPMMRELRKLKRVLDRMGFRIKAEWLPSVAKKFADCLSRRFPRDDLQIRRQLRRSVMAGMNAPADAFPYRPLGENPVMKRRQAYAELDRKWGQRQVSNSVPSSGPDNRNGTQAANDQVSGNPSRPRLASTTVAPTDNLPSFSGGTTPSDARTNLERIPEAEPELAPASGRSQHGRSRTATRLTLADAAVQRMARMPPSTALSRSARLLKEYAWSSKTTTARNSQWSTWLAFCEEDGRAVLPVTEAHLLAFIGWIMTQRDVGKRSISSTSIPQYLSAVRQMQLACLSTPVPSFPLVHQVLRAYRKWKEENFPKLTVRCGLGADVVQRIWALGMETKSISVLRDAACCVFAFCLNGLRDSSVVSFESCKVNVTTAELTARLSMVKGREASQEQLVSFKRWGEQPSPADLWNRWKTARGNHPRFFALPGDSLQAHSGGLNGALSRCLTELNVHPPPGGHYSSHSLRIGAHTEQVLLNIPREARMARFGWGPHSEEMTAVYFDRTLRATPASFWFFGACCLFPTPLAPASPAPKGVSATPVSTA